MCTGIRLIAQDGTVVHARTMEFGENTESNVIVIPRDFERTGTAPALTKTTSPENRPGAKWKSQYASVGANGKGFPILADGLNEAGLAAGTFYHPGFAEYMPCDDESKTIAPWEVCSWILDQWKDVNEVKENIKEITVANVVFPEWSFIPPFHYVVHDADGNSIVIEYVGGQLQVHDNPLGVITNSPTFDWHMINLRNYLNFSPNNLPPLELKRAVCDYETVVELVGFGQGTGMLGMPGDITPPSRFVRAVAFTQSILPELLESGQDAILQAFHVLNNFDIPKGMARDIHEVTEKASSIVADYTLWTTANDLKEKKFYFRTYENSQIRMVDLKEYLEVKEVTTFPMYDKKEEIRALTPLSNPTKPPLNQGKRKRI
ncbi:MAG: choloylglycine hydrolase family protein [Calothrix sp. MO_167.B12]|nr:choloylglycine hydrolase family protein [Calothrix sp. MO_167.B12]